MAVDPYVAASRESRLRDRTPLPPARAWHTGRPGDIEFDQPMGDGFGYQGPDQGYALKLAERLRRQVTLKDGETWDDARARALDIALRRAALLGRAPISEDLEMGFRLRDEHPDESLLLG